MLKKSRRTSIKQKEHPPRVLKRGDAKTKRRARALLSRMKKSVPDARMILRYSNPWELLVAVMLSAQCTDKRVNQVTASLFKKYRTLEDYANASIRVFERDIKSTGFYRMKAKHIIATAILIRDTHGGVVPRRMEDLIRLPGVARKTANVVLGNAYGIVEGIAVDTHVRRLARVFELTDEHNPDKIEKDLMALFPRTAWFPLTYYFIEFGRRFCPARAHDHASCRDRLGLA